MLREKVQKIDIIKKNFVNNIKIRVIFIWIIR